MWPRILEGRAIRAPASRRRLPPGACRRAPRCPSAALPEPSRSFGGQAPRSPSYPGPRRRASVLPMRVVIRPRFLSNSRRGTNGDGRPLGSGPPHPLMCRCRRLTTTAVGIRDEPHSGTAAIRLREPSTEGGAAKRKHVLDDRRVAFDQRPHRAGARQNEHPSDLPRLPPEAFACDRRRQASLLIELAQHALERRHVRFDFHREHDPEAWMPRKDVERPALAEVRVRHLDLDVPSHVAQASCGLADERSVSLIEESIDGCAAPADFEHETGIERAENLSDHTHGERIRGGLAQTARSGSENIRRPLRDRPVSIPSGAGASSRLDRSVDRPSCVDGEPRAVSGASLELYRHLPAHSLDAAPRYRLARPSGGRETQIRGSSRHRRGGGTAGRRMPSAPVNDPNVRSISIASTALGPRDAGRRLGSARRGCRRRATGADPVPRARRRRAPVVRGWRRGRHDCEHVGGTGRDRPAGDRLGADRRQLRHRFAAERRRVRPRQLRAVPARRRQCLRSTGSSRRRHGSVAVRRWHLDGWVRGVAARVPTPRAVRRRRRAQPGDLHGHDRRSRVPLSGRRVTRRIATRWSWRPPHRSTACASRPAGERRTTRGSRTPLRGWLPRCSVARSPSSSTSPREGTSRDLARHWRRRCCWISSVPSRRLDRFAALAYSSSSGRKSRVLSRPPALSTSRWTRNSALPRSAAQRSWSATPRS